MRFWKTFLALCVACVLALSLVGCAGVTEPTVAGSEPSSATEPAASIPADGSELGEGQHSFTFQVTMPDGTVYTYTVRSDEKTVGAALQTLGLIDGDDSEYGLYVTTVLGMTLDYDADGYWWALSENGADSPVGVDSLPITDGSTYAFTATEA